MAAFTYLTFFTSDVNDCGYSVSTEFRCFYQAWCHLLQITACCLCNNPSLFSISSCFLCAGDGGMSGVELDQGRFRVSGVSYSDKKGALWGVWIFSTVTNRQNLASRLAGFTPAKNWSVRLLLGQTRGQWEGMCGLLCQQTFQRGIHFPDWHGSHHMEDIFRIFPVRIAIFRAIISQEACCGSKKSCCEQINIDDSFLWPVIVSVVSVSHLWSQECASQALTHIMFHITDKYSAESPGYKEWPQSAPDCLEASTSPVF